MRELGGVQVGLVPEEVEVAQVGLLLPCVEEREGVFHHVPESLPALLHARKVQRRAAGVGFDWPDLDGPLAKVAEEVDELRRELGRTGAPAPETEPDPAVAAEIGGGGGTGSPGCDVIRPSDTCDVTGEGLCEHPTASNNRAANASSEASIPAHTSPAHIPL